MKVNPLPQEFVQARPVIEKLEEAGYEAYFVGGSVRDIMMDHPIHDVDIATSAYPSEVQATFSHTIDLGIEHGTVLVLLNDDQYEVTTFRTESTYQDYRRPDHVTFVRSLKEDLKRRDFRMNALAMNAKGEVIDLFDGLDDIRHHRICAVGDAYERFHEDALRMMRAVRFASQLDFDIEEQTYEAICEHHALLKKISIERIQIEWLKMMAGVNPKKGLEGFISSGCFESCPQMAGKEKELRHLLDCVTTGVTEAQAWLLLAASFHYNEKQAKALMREWKCSKAMMQLVSGSLEAFYTRASRTLTESEQYHLGEKKLALIESCLFFYPDAPEDDTWQARYNALPIHSLNDLAVDGKYLMAQCDKKPGRWLGLLLHHLEEQVVTGKLANQKETLLTYSKEWLAQNEGI